MFRFIKLLLVIVVSVLFLSFAAVNRQTVHLSLFPLPYNADIPQFLLIIACCAVGVFIGGLAVNLKLLSRSRQYRAEHSRVIALQNEITALKEEQHNQPLLKQ